MRYLIAAMAFLAMACVLEEDDTGDDINPDDGGEVEPRGTDQIQIEYECLPYLLDPDYNIHVYRMTPVCVPCPSRGTCGSGGDAADRETCEEFVPDLEASSTACAAPTG